jgi:hypothetical protein
MQAKKEMWVVTFAIFIEIFNADVLIREDITVDQFIDVVLGNRKYLTCVYVRHICTLAFFCVDHPLTFDYLYSAITRLIKLR